MTTRELLYIKTIADEKSMTRAAQKLFVTQPSLSHCVMTLEQQLGTRLFTRTAGGLVLTYAGEKYYRMACEVLRVYAAFESEINEERALSQGRVTVGITNYLATAHLPRMLPAFHREHPGIEVRIGDPETCEELPRGEVGEILCRGYNVMKGYYNMPEETARTISPDGWLHSGDLGTMDEDGYVRVTGRIKDMIIRGGENVYPREIEEFLMGMPGVLDIQVVAVPSRKYGEEVGAFIIARPDVPVAPEDVRAFCRGKIAWYKIPRYIAVVDGFPLTASGKIQKFKLREMAAERWPEVMAEPDSKTAK